MRIFVDGEISGWRIYPSGYAYFTLKDAGAQISAVMFKSSFDRCRVKGPHETTGTTRRPGEK